DRAAKAQLTHQPFHRAAGDLDALSLQLGPYLVGTIDAVVLLPDPLDLALEPLVAQLAGRWWTRDRRAIGRRGELQHPADRLDPELLLVGIDVARHFGCLPSS